ncbi:MAG: hypothetical protein KDJ69_12035 [Nitratireductor sp.]|nr:hypothetical protein [Nitratireductor sp.]
MNERPDYEMGVHVEPDEPQPSLGRRIWSWLVTAAASFLLISCATLAEVGGDEGLWEIRNFEMLPAGKPSPTRLFFLTAAGHGDPGCHITSSKVICNPGPDGWRAVAEYSGGRMVAWWQEKKVQ